jgi:tetratricopeptide (TPR) repeat protein
MKKEFSQERFKKSDYLFLGGIIALVLLIRLVYLIDIKDNPFFNVLIADGHYHDNWARDILNGDWLSLEKGVLYKSPLYPYFLASVYAMFGHDLFIARTVQIIISLAAYIVVYRLARMYFDETVARITLVMAAFYGTFIYFEGELELVFMPFVLNLFLLFLLSRKSFGSNRLQWFLAGTILGLSALARPTILLFIPFIFIWLFFIFKQNGSIKRVTGCMAFFLLGVALLVAPITIRNSMLGEKFVLISSNGGINFYLGNNPDYDETTSIKPGEMWDRLTKEPSIVSGRKLRIEEAESYWYSKAAGFILSEPLSFLKLVFKKTALFWHSYEIKRNKDIYFFKRFSTVLQLPLLTFGIVAPLALLGIVISLYGWRNYLLLYFYVLYVMASTVAFFVTARYRLPLVPVLMMFAGYSLHWFYQRARQKDVKKVGTFLFSFFILLFLINYDFFDVKEKTFASSHYNLGQVYSTTKQYDRAIEEFKRTLELTPAHRLENASTHLSLANVYKQKGEYNRAIEEARKAVSILPDYVKAYRLQAEVYYETERYAEAIEGLQLSLRLEPDDAESYFLLGNIYNKQGRYADAVANYKNAGSLKPDHLWAHYNLGIMFYRNGKLHEAKKHLQITVHFNPDYTKAHYNLGLINYELGLLDEAIKSYKKTSELDPKNYKAYNNLGVIYGRRSLLPEAIVQFEKALSINPDDEEAKSNLKKAREKLAGR